MGCPEKNPSHRQYDENGDMAGYFLGSLVDPEGLADLSLEMWDSEKTYLSCTDQINYIWKHKLMCVVSYVRYN